MIKTQINLNKQKKSIKNMKFQTFNNQIYIKVRIYEGEIRNLGSETNPISKREVKTALEALKNRGI